MSYAKRHWKLLFWTIFSWMFVQWTALKDRCSISLWSKDLFPEQDNKDNISISPPPLLTPAFSSPHPTSQQRLGKFSSKIPYKIRDFVISGFPNCDASLLPRQYLPVPLCIAPIRLEEKENQCEQEAHDTCCLISLAQHPWSCGSLIC